MVGGTAAAPITVLLFAGLREHAGQDRLALEATTAPIDAAGCWERCCARFPGLEEAAGSRASLRVARNRELVGWDAAVLPGDELAFMPPVSGGRGDGAEAGPVRVRVGPDPIDVAQLAASLPTTGAGARVTFCGIVRDPDDGRSVPYLDYEAYQEMAEAECRRLAEAAVRECGALAVAVQHRTGRVAAGEPSVAVVAVAAHRGAAFEACSRVIDRLKAEAPIWKRVGPPATPC